MQDFDLRLAAFKLIEAALGSFNGDGCSRSASALIIQACDTAICTHILNWFIREEHLDIE